MGSFQAMIYGARVEETEGRQLKRGEVEGRLNGKQTLWEEQQDGEVSSCGQTKKRIFKIRETSAGLIEVRIEDGQRWGWELSTDISDGTQGQAHIRPNPPATRDTAAGE